jgi:NADPH-ferrihemoprotein reductase
MIEPNMSDIFVYSGELTISGKTLQSVFDAKNPFYANVTTMKSIIQRGDRRYLHLEVDLTGSGVAYETGDHIGIFPQNDPREVEKFGRLLRLSSLDDIFTLTTIDESAAKKYPFPCPCSFRTALTYYIDIRSPPRTNIIKFLADYAGDLAEKNALLEMMQPANKDRYAEYVLVERRSILDILEEFPSCLPPVFGLFELLPRIQCRYYSISSSYKV